MYQLTDQSRGLEVFRGQWIEMVDLPITQVPNDCNQELVGEISDFCHDCEADRESVCRTDLWGWVMGYGW